VFVHERVPFDEPADVLNGCARFHSAHTGFSKSTTSFERHPLVMRGATTQTGVGMTAAVGARATSARSHVAPRRINADLRTDRGVRVGATALLWLGLLLVTYGPECRP
jgi:hypothetical protein